MNKQLGKVKEIINKNKKKLIIGVIVFVVAVAGVVTTGITYAYNKAKSNIHYTVDDAKEIVREAVGGEILKVNKKLEFELGYFSFEYDFKIRDANNILREVTVDSRLGVITEFDNYFD